MNRLIDALNSGRVLVMDGAMGTELQRLGWPGTPAREGDARDSVITVPEPPHLWNIPYPEMVCAVHRAYLEAGAEVLLTNTFQANATALRNRSLEHYLANIWNAAMHNARIFQDPAPMVLADIGPIESSTPEELWTLLNLCRSADGLLLETWTVRQPWYAIADANAAATGPQLPLLLSFTYHGPASRHDVLADARTGAKWCDSAPLTALGVNCGKDLDMDDMVEIVRVYREQTDVPLFVRPNAGSPRWTARGAEYPWSPAAMADKLWPLLEAGVRMVGGCCGTTPAHIAAFRRVVDQWNQRNV